MTTLHLTLHKKWFDEIAAGRKKHEYRERKPYWESRLARQYDDILFKNGYGKSAPMMRVRFLGCRKSRNKFFPDGCFAIRLGEIVETKNYCPSTHDLQS
jgi:hypothetical protein